MYELPVCATHTLGSKETVRKQIDSASFNVA